MWARPTGRAQRAPNWARPTRAQLANARVIERKSLFCVKGLARAGFLEVGVKSGPVGAYGEQQNCDMRQGLYEE